MREQNRGTLRWYFVVEDDDSIAITQERPAGVRRRHHYFDEREEPREQDEVLDAPPAGTEAQGRRTNVGYELSFFVPAAAFGPQPLAGGRALPTHICVTGSRGATFCYSERAIPAVERVWLSPERWLPVVLGEHK